MNALCVVCVCSFLVVLFFVWNGCLIMIGLSVLLQYNRLPLQRGLINMCRQNTNSRNKNYTMASLHVFVYDVL